MTSSFRVRIRILQARRKRGAAGAAVPPEPEKHGKQLDMEK